MTSTFISDRAGRTYATSRLQRRRQIIGFLNEMGASMRGHQALGCTDDGRERPHRVDPGVASHLGMKVERKLSDFSAERRKQNENMKTEMEICITETEFFWR
jgi:hypothetical protein